ncbi:YKU80 [Candida theae]|uniref:DNA helicase n=1 Tax=Candida theae TaxID=1198502 RepID=A0AAD5BAR9_9ASCO|nr:YKU80 [Candida theae]KAI5948844.1 YKU80 [Candida theae]
MDTKSVPNQGETDFQMALKFSMSLLIKQLLKNRKSDRYAFAIYTPGDVQFLYSNTPVTLSKVKQFYEASVRAHSVASDTSSEYSILDALANALQNQIANKFVRSIWVLTNGACSIEESNVDVDKLRNISESCNVATNLLLLGNEGNGESKKHFENFAETFDGRFSVFSFDELAAKGPPLKLIGPRCSTDCSLALIQGGAISDDIQLDVQVYPGIKVQTQAHGHEYVQDSNSEGITRVKKQTKYYIKANSDIADEIFDTRKYNNDDSDANEDKQYIRDSEYTYGFKYSQRNVVALLPELEEAATLETVPGINIIGFIETRKLPITYLTDEPSYVVPSSRSAPENEVAFNSFVQALTELRFAAIVRYVQKETSEAQICCALAQKLKVGEKWGHALILHRLAMKEDEKIGKFPEFKQPEESGLDSVMEKFVDSKKLGNDTTQSDSLNNLKVGLLESKPFTSEENLSTSLENMLLPASPASKRFNYYVQKLLYKSLRTEGTLSNFVNQDQFIEKFLTSDEKHTLLNLGNIFDVNEKALYVEGFEKAFETEAKLKSVFDINFAVQAKPSRKKRKTDSVFGSDRNDQFDEYFEIDDILGA